LHLNHIRDHDGHPNRDGRRRAASRFGLRPTRLAATKDLHHLLGHHPGEAAAHGSPAVARHGRCGQDVAGSLTRGARRAALGRRTAAPRRQGAALAWPKPARAARAERKAGNCWRRSGGCSPGALAADAPQAARARAHLEACAGQAARREVPKWATPGRANWPRFRCLPSGAPTGRRNAPGRATAWG
jgi:hypothetical protein